MDTSYIDDAVNAWILEKEGISGSVSTRKNYAQTLSHFRARLRAKGKDLDLDLWADRQDRVAWRRAAAQLAGEIRDFAQFSYLSRDRVKDTTCNARLIAISSFYEFVLGSHFDEYMNPVKRITRPKIHVYEKSRALNVERVAQAIGAIDTTTKAGARDFAIFAVAFETSRRAREVLGLRWKHVELINQADVSSLKISLTFERCKGGKTLYHALSPMASQAILHCVAVCYEINPLYLDPSRPLWPSFSSAVSCGSPLQYNGLRYVCKARGIPQFHMIRHTTAHQCDAAGMPLREIQALLGHSDITTTMKYLARVRQGGENRFAGTLASVFGFVSVSEGVNMV